jgi:protoporphyrinogen oxidase
MFGYVPGGYARVLDRFQSLLESEGVRLSLGSPVKGIEGRGATIVVEGSDGTRQSFDRVVVTVPAPLAPSLCTGLSPTEEKRLEDVAYQGIVCASLLLKEPLSPYYITNITDSWAPFTAVIEMSALVDRKHFGGSSLVYLPKYLPSDDPAFDVPDEAWRDSFFEALSRMYPSFCPQKVIAFVCRAHGMCTRSRRSTIQTNCPRKRRACRDSSSSIPPTSSTVL